MTQNDVKEYCLSKPKTYIDYPFGDISLCIRIDGGKHTPIFAQIDFPKGKNKITIRCNPELAVFYRSEYPDKVTRGYYCPPVQQPYWNTVSLELPDETIYAMLDEAYRSGISKLPKYLQKEIYGRVVQ